MRRMKLLSVRSGCALRACAPAFAQSYPTRAIRLVVPFGAGGGTDNLARIIEPLVSKALGQPIVIENRPGGGSVIGMDAVAKAAPDGYTLVMTDTSIAVNPSLQAAALRHAEGLRAGEPARDRAGDPDGASESAGEDAAGVRRAREGAARQVQLRVGRQRRLHASRRRAAQARGRHRRRARALQGHGPGDERPDRRACRRDVLGHLVGAAVHGRRHACARSR